MYKFFFYFLLLLILPLPIVLAFTPLLTLYAGVNIVYLIVWFVAYMTKEDKSKV